MTPLASGFLISPYHLMDPGGHSRLTPPLPNNGLGCRVPYGLNPIEMTGPAGNTQVGISCHLFVMRKMALATIPQFLSRMTELGRIRVAGATAQVCVGRFLIFGLIYQ